MLHHEFSFVCGTPDKRHGAVSRLTPCGVMVQCHV